MRLGGLAFVMALTCVAASARAEGGQPADAGVELAEVGPGAQHAQLKIAGELAGELKVVTYAADVTLTLRVETTGIATAENVKVAIRPFLDATNQSFGATVEPTTVGTLTPIDGAIVDVKVNLPVLGVYVADVVLAQPGRVDRTRLTVTRVAPPTTFTLNELPARSMEVLKAEDLALFRLSGQVAVGAPAEKVDIALVGSTFKGHDQKNYDGQLSMASVSADLAAAASTPIQLSIRGFTRAGEYSGTLRATSGGGRVEKTFVVFVRDSAWCAGSWIGFGVALSSLLKYIATRYRPRLALQNRAQRLLDRIDPAALGVDDPTPIELGVLTALKRHVANALRDLEADAGHANAAGTALDVVDAKILLLAPWSAAERRVDGLRPPDLAFAELGSPLGTPREAVDRARTVLESETATQANLVAIGASIDQLPANLDKLVNARVRTDIESLRAQVAQRIANGTFKPGFQHAASVIEEAFVEATAAKPDTEKALEQYGRARRAYALAIADDLQRKLDAPEPFISPARWSDVVRPTTELLQSANAHTEQDTHRLVLGVERAYTAYLNAVARGLGAAVADRENELRTEAVGKATREKRQPLIELARAKLADVDGALAGHRLEGAESALTALREALLKDEEARGGTRGSFLETFAATLDTARSLVVGLREPVSDEHPARGLPSTADVLAAAARAQPKLWLVNLGATLGIGVLATLFGVVVLWGDNPTWGGMSSYGVAFLWGLGLHQASFDGAVVAVSSFGGLLQGKASANG